MVRHSTAQHVRTELLPDSPACSAVLLTCLCSLSRPAGIYGPNPGLAKLLFAILFPVGLTMNTLHGTGGFDTVCLVASAQRQHCVTGSTGVTGLLLLLSGSY